MPIILCLFLWISSFPLYACWADEALENMTLEEKVGQLFVIPICPPRGNPHFKYLEEFLEKYPVGGVLFKQAHPIEQVSFLNALQSITNIPFITLADAEWGLGMQMKDALSYPRNLTLGAIQDLSLLKAMGHQIAEQSHLVGAHINLAPVADVNTNPQNPIIHTRSFGDDPQKVGAQVLSLFQGMQEGGLWACVKHFPGHGDVIVDSHHDLPIILHSLDRLRQVEWVPFKQAIQEGVKAVMSAHLLVPVYDTIPCPFSYRVMTDILQQELGFEGLIITDALNMKALTNYFSPGEVGLKAFLAGHHFLLYGSHKDEEVDDILNEFVPEAYQTILQACMEGRIPEATLNKRILKILQAKEELGLHLNRYTPEVSDLMKALHRLAYDQLKEKLFEEAATLYRDEGLPNPKEKIAYIQVGKEKLTPFYFYLQDRFDVTPFLYQKGLSLEGFSTVIVALYQHEFPKELKHLHTPYVALFTSPYVIESCPEKGTLIVGYESTKESEKVVAEILQGDRKAQGKLPISLP